MSRPLRIAFVCPYPAGAVLPPGDIRPRYRGREHAAPWVRALSGALARRPEVELRLFVDTRSVRQRHRVTHEGVDITFLPRWEPYRLDPYHGHWPATLRVRRALADFQPDLVQGFGTEGAHGVVAARMPWPNVVFIQGIVEACAQHHGFPLHRRAVLQALERRTVRRTNGLIAETCFARDWALRVKPEALVRIIPHGSNPEFFAARPAFAEKRIAVVGSLFPLKGVDTALRALAGAADPDTRLIFIGQGYERENLVRLAGELGLANRVDFLGQLPRADIIRELERARALLIASRVDTSPNVITEAHACGLPVIGTAAGGIPDMIEDGRDGYLAPVDDHAALARHMDRLIAEPALARHMGQAGREKVRVLNDPDRIAALHLDLYRTVLERRPGATR